MDNFMNKLSQRISAQDTIKANFMADTAEKEALKKQLAEYDAVLQSVRNLYLKQEENSEVFTQLAAKLEGMGGDASEKQALLKEIKDYINRSDEFTHKECVKVYRNVQAVVVEELKKQNEELSAKLDAMSKTQRTTRNVAVSAMFFALLAAAALAAQLLIQFGIVSI